MSTTLSHCPTGICYGIQSYFLTAAPHCSSPAALILRCVTIISYLNYYSALSLTSLLPLLPYFALKIVIRLRVSWSKSGAHDCQPKILQPLHCPRVRVTIHILPYRGEPATPPSDFICKLLSLIPPQQSWPLCFLSLGCTRTSTLAVCVNALPWYLHSLLSHIIWVFPQMFPNLCDGSSDPLCIVYPWRLILFTDIPDIPKTLISCFWTMRKWSYRWSCDPSLDNNCFLGLWILEGWCGGNMSRSVSIPAVGPWQSLPDTWLSWSIFSQPDSASILSILWITLSPSNKFSLFKLASVIFHYMKLTTLLTT